MWYPGSQRAYTYPDADSYLGSVFVRADAASMNGKGGSDIWRWLALLQVPIKVCGAWKGVQGWRDAADRRHTAGRTLGLANRLDGKNPKKELSWF